jgi:hypothetical protein
MKAKLVCLVGVLLLASPMAVFAGSSCTPGASAGPTILAADGTTLNFDFVPASSDAFYTVNLNNGTGVVITTGFNYDDGLNVNNNATTIYDSHVSPCATALAAGSAATGYRDITALQPALPLNSFRAAVWPQNTGAYTIKVHNNDAAAGHYLYVRVTDTTLYSPTFTDNGTGGAFHTYYTFVNNSSANINGVLSLTTLGNSPATYTSGTTYNNIPPNGGSLGGSSSTITPQGQSVGGSAKFVNDGPEDTITSVAVVTNFNGFVNNVGMSPLHRVK